MTTPNQPMPSGLESLLGIGAFQIGGGDTGYGQGIDDTFVNNLVTLPFASLDNMLEILEQILLKLPFEALEAFKSLVPDWVSSGVSDVGTAVEKILGILDPRNIPLLLEDWTEWLSGPFSLIETIINQIMDIFGGLSVTPVNDAVQGVKDWWNAITGKTSNLTSGGALPGSSLTGSVADTLIPDLTGLRDGLKNAFDRFTGGSGFSLSDLLESAGSMSEQQAILAQKVQQLEDAQSEQTNSGVTGVENFEYTNASTWDPALWDLEYLEGSSSIAYLAVVDGHNGGMVGVSNGAATQWGLYTGVNDETLTDFQEAKVVISHRMTVPALGPFGSPPAIRVHCRANAAKTQWVGAQLVAGGACRFYYRNGGAVTLVTGTNDGATHANPAVGATFAIRAGTGGGLRVYQAVLNGVVINSWTDGGSVTAVGASNRGGGCGQRWNDDNAPGRFAYFSLTDNAPVAVTGTGFSVYRTSTSNVAKAAGEAQIANSFFGNTLYISNGLTWTDSSTQLTVTKAGWYKFTLFVKLGGGGTGGGYNSQTMEGTLYVNGSVVARTPRQNSGGTGSVITSVGGDFPSVYLVAGDVVKPGVWNAAGSVNLTGTADGTRTVFSGALMN